MTARRRLRLAALIAVPLVCMMAAACIIADPPTDLPRPSPKKPTIIRSTADPPTSRVLGRFPDNNLGEAFEVDVDVDPSAVLEWRLFVDYDDPTVSNVDTLVGHEVLLPDLASPDAGPRHVRMADGLGQSPDPTRCHVIEGAVALVVNGVSSFTNQNTPAVNANLGDSIVWFYSPTGDLSGCPVYKSGLDGAFIDVASDAPLQTGEGGPD
jgi:hypothetical protein